MRPTTLLGFLLPALSLAQMAPFSSLAAFNKSLPACAQTVQNMVFAQALNIAPYGCSATIDVTALVKSTNSTDLKCICLTTKVPQAPLESSSLGGPAFEEVGTSACGTNASDVNELLAQTVLFIELCQGVENGTWVGDLSTKGAYQAPVAASMASSTSWVYSLMLAVGAATLVAAGLV